MKTIKVSESALESLKAMAQKLQDDLNTACFLLNSYKNNIPINYLEVDNFFNRIGK